MRSYILFFYILCNTAIAEERLWSEGACVEEGKHFEGATRDFYNRGAGQPWKNRLGDWVDNHFTPQGNVPFSTFIIPAKKKNDVIAINVTSLVKLWQEGTLPNQGFRLHNPQNRPLSFKSKEQPNYSYRPILQIYTISTYFEIPVDADTILNKSTYRCLGSSPILNAKHPVLIRFDINSIKQPITKAMLKLTLAENAVKPSSIEIFAVNVQESQDIPLEGFSSKILSNEDLNEDPQIILYTPFEDDNWSDEWEETYRGEYKIITSNPKEKFSPLSGNALEITINEGKFLGIGAKYLLPEDLKQVYFRYYLRLGDSWELDTTGKLPGFSGTYHSKPYRAGWGGRKSNGSNGWSARMFMNSTLSAINTLPNATPIGNYVYHADMKTIYGDMEYWHLNNESLLEKNTWYSIEQYIQLNTANKKNGQLTAWVNGKLVYNNSTIRFSDHPSVGLEGVWLNVYHGGKTKAPKDLTIFIDDIIIASTYIGPRKSIANPPNIAK